MQRILSYLVICLLVGFMFSVLQQKVYAEPLTVCIIESEATILEERIESLGFSVEIIPVEEVSTTDFTRYAAIIESEAMLAYHNPNEPVSVKDLVENQGVNVICLEDGMEDIMLDYGGSYVGAPHGVYNITIVNNGHPITQEYEVGENFQVSYGEPGPPHYHDFGVVSLTDLPPDFPLVKLAEPLGDGEKIALGAYAPNGRLVLYGVLVETYIEQFTEEGLRIFDKALLWATGQLVEKLVFPVPYYHQGDTNWCGPASLAMILKYYYGNIQEIHSWDIARDLRMGHDNGFWLGPEWFEVLPRILHNPPLSEVKEYVEANYPGLKVELREWKNEDEVSLQNYTLNTLDQKIPIMLAVRKLKHFVVICGYEKTKSGITLYINDPSGKLLDDLKAKDRTEEHSLIDEPVKWDDLVDLYLDNGFTTFVIKGTPEKPIKGTLYIRDGDIDAIHPDGTITQLYLSEGLMWIKGFLPIPFIKIPEEGYIYVGDTLSVLVMLSNHENQTNKYQVKGEIKNPNGDVIVNLELSEKSIEVSPHDYRHPLIFHDVLLSQENKFTVGDGYSLTVSLFDDQSNLCDRLTVPFSVSEHETGTISQRQTLTHVIDVSPSQEAIEFSLKWSNSDLDLTVIAPNGTEYKGKQLLRTQEKLTIVHPQAGSWTVKVFGKVVSGSGNYNLTVRGMKAIPENQDIQSGLKNLEAIINLLSDDYFVNNPAQRKKALQSKIEEVIFKLNEGEYTDAVNKLLHDIREKLDLRGENTWVTKDLSGLTDMIDNIATHIIALSIIT